MKNEEVLAAMRAALAEIEATGLAEGVFFGGDEAVGDNLKLAIEHVERQQQAQELLFEACYEVAQWHVGDGDRCGEIARSLAQKLEALRPELKEREEPPPQPD